MRTRNLLEHCIWSIVFGYINKTQFNINFTDQWWIFTCFCLALIKYNLKEENWKSEAKSLKGKNHQEAMGQKAKPGTSIVPVVLTCRNTT